MHMSNWRIGFQRQRDSGKVEAVAWLGEQGTGAHWSGGIKAESDREAKELPVGMLTFFQVTDPGGGKWRPVL